MLYRGSISKKTDLEHVLVAVVRAIGLVVLLLMVAVYASACNRSNTDGGSGGEGAMVDSASPGMGTLGTDTPTEGATVMPSSGETSSFPEALNTLRTDGQILGAIDAANASEITAGTVARQRANSSQVRAFAQMMIDDHTAMQRKGRSLSSEVNVDSAQYTRQLQSKSQADLQRLRGTSRGASFDRAYLAQQVAAHRETLALLGAARDRATDSSLRSMINTAIPKVQQHLQRALALEETANTVDENAMPSSGDSTLIPQTQK